ncbi:hypothetical protein [Erwinia amylovora]|uniref:hypothetical protein n=1 Tax=Erwinia amylovora TaxID=552 RepID=UPI0014447738|nr:hypothetical protein [Erwinia amylovora]
MEEINNDNKRKFITETKDIAATNPYCDWDNVSWGRGITFYRYSKLNSKKKDKEVLSYDFCELVKSYIFRFHLTNPNKAQEVIKAFRLIEIPLLKSCGVADITKLTHVIFDEAILEAYLRFIPDTVKKIYKDIRKINDFLCKKGIINSHVSTWYFKLDKGFGYSIKWIPDCMVSVAKEAISRLRILGTNAKATSEIISSEEAFLYKALDKKPFDIMTVSDLKKLGFDYSLISLSKECSAFIKKVSKSEVSVKSFWNYLIKKDVKNINIGKKNSFYTKGKLVVLSHNQLNGIKGNDILIAKKALGIL